MSRMDKGKEQQLDGWGRKVHVYTNIFFLKRKILIFF
jgi:hypothetical protein